MISVYREMLEIRTRITELLDNVQSEATVVESGTRDSSAHLQAIIDDKPQNIATVAPNDMLPDQEHGLLEFGVAASLPEDADPLFCQRSPGKFAIIFGLSMEKNVYHERQTYCSATPPAMSTMSLVHNPSYLSMARTLRERPCRVLRPYSANHSLFLLRRALETKYSAPGPDARNWSRRRAALAM
jgi:hypothetical protein